MKLHLVFMLCGIPCFANYSFVRQVTIDHTKVSGSQSNYTTLFHTVYRGCLNSSPNSSVTSITVTAGCGKNVRNNDYLKFDSEIMLVTAGGGTTGLTVTRGQKSTSGASHTTGADGTNMFLANSSNGNGVVTSSNGYDIVISTNSFCTAVANFERVVYSGTTGVVEIWYGPIATLSSTVDTPYYVCYGNSAITTDQQHASATWHSRYQVVYHFPDGTTLGLNDSTSNANNATNTGTGAGAGLIDGGLVPGGLNNYLTVTGVPIGTNDRSISMWIKVASSASHQSLLDSGALTANNRFYFFIDSATNTMATNPCCGGTTDAATSVTNSLWHLVAIETHSANTIAFFLDGAVDGSSSGFSLNTSAATQYIGKNSGGSGFGINGTVDEVRVTNTAVANAAGCSYSLFAVCGYYTTEFNDQSQDGTFYSSTDPTIVPYSQDSFAKIK